MNTTWPQARDSRNLSSTNMHSRVCKVRGAHFSRRNRKTNRAAASAAAALAPKLPRALLFSARGGECSFPSFLTVQIVDLEEEDELLVGALAGELMHRLDELGHADGAVLVAVEDAEGALHEERLQKIRGKLN